MKFSLEIDINAPRKKVIELFNSSDNLKKWQKELTSFKHLTGDPGQVGATSQLNYKSGKREIEMVETITKSELPDYFSATYEAKNMWNKVDNTFLEIDSTKTKWKTVSEFRCQGLMKVMEICMPGSFKKQCWKYMEAFKNFVEENNDY